MRFTILLTMALMPFVIPATAAETPKPLFNTIELYAPGHFGNWYEGAGEYEMRDCLREARHWGCTRYGDWFDMIDCSDVFRNSRQYGLGRAMWDMKKANFRSAGQVGLSNEFVMTPNHIYIDQRLPERLAEDGGEVFGQLVCPSKPEVRRMILENYDRLFADLKASGIKIDALNTFLRDYGGCLCKECDPWILTWARLNWEIFEIAQKHYPAIEMNMVGWWWKPEEHKLLAEWADREHPGWVKSIHLYIIYGQSTVPGVVLPEGCKKGAFVHIGYADKKTPRDLYGHLGPVIAPVRLEKTLFGLRKKGVTELMAYSEGIYDEVNKAIYAGLASGQYKSSREVLIAYAERYFGTDKSTSEAWADWLSQWGEPFSVDTVQAKAELEKLLAITPKRETVRVQEWVLKADLFDLHQQIMKTGGADGKWTPERLKLVEQFWAVREKIHRGLWGLGPQRHIFTRRYINTPWYASWAKHMKQKAEKMGEEY